MSNGDTLKPCLYGVTSLNMSLSLPISTKLVTFKRFKVFTLEKYFHVEETQSKQIIEPQSFGLG